MICQRCGKEKGDRFPPKRRQCRDCAAEQSRIWRQENTERHRENARRWAQCNKDKSWEIKKKYRQKTGPRLAANLRNRLGRLVRGQKGGSAVRDLGCTIPELLKYFEAKFQEGMSWDNYGEWHIDHIVPLSSFDLTNPAQVKKACHYTNLQPLWAADNIRKGAAV